MRSPSTPLEAQLSVDRGGGNARGLIQSHRIIAAVGSSAHQPIQRRLHTASIKRGRATTLVHTLQGLAWRAHVSSSMRKRSAMRRSMVMPSHMAPGAASGSRELHDNRIDRKRVSRLCKDRLDDAVALGAEKIFHLHGLYDHQCIACLDLLADDDVDRLDEPRHGAQQDL